MKVLPLCLIIACFAADTIFLNRAFYNDESSRWEPRRFGTIDLDTGINGTLPFVLKDLGTSGLPANRSAGSPVGVAFSSDGNSVYTLLEKYNDAGTDYEYLLTTVNPQTGKIIEKIGVVRDVTDPSISMHVRAIDVNPIDGKLYGIRDGDSKALDILYLIDETSGDAKPVGNGWTPKEIGNAKDLSFDSFGNLIVLEESHRSVIYSVTASNGTISGAYAEVNMPLSAIMHDTNNNLLATSSNCTESLGCVLLLYSVSPSTGDTAFLGQIDDDLNNNPFWGNPFGGDIFIIGRSSQPTPAPASQPSGNIPSIDSGAGGHVYGEQGFTLFVFVPICLALVGIALA